MNTKSSDIQNLLMLMREIFPCEDKFGALVGYRGVEMKKGQAIVALDVEDKHLSPSGAVHGGVLSTFVDFAMGAAVFTILPKGHKCSTIEFKINYFSPVKLGETIFAMAKIKYPGKSHAVTECHVYREHEHKKDIAMALGTYNIYA